jgi:hypothetical protein
MTRELRDRRSYTASPLPALQAGRSSPPEKDVLLALYTQVCTSWRSLLDIRFKLLGLVPTVSILVLASLLSSEGWAKGISISAKALLCLFGLLVTFGLFLYDRRNSELHDDLISRGRRIEEELGIDTGHFRGRLKPTIWLVSHTSALVIIYGTAMIGWLIALLAMWRTC